MPWQNHNDVGILSPSLMRLQSRLFLLVAGIAIPLALLSILLVALVVDHERETFRNGAFDRNRAFMSAVDAELRGHIRTLQALAEAEELHTNDLPALHRRMQRVLGSQPSWHTVILSDARGRQLINGLRALDTPVLADPDSASLRRALESVVPFAGNVVRWPSISEYGIPVRLPLLVGDGSPRVLTAVVDPGQFEALIEAQDLPAGWVSGLVDATGRFIARLPRRSPDAMASSDFRAAMARSDEGWYRGRTIEGRDTFTAHRTSSVTGWTIGLAIPAEQIYRSATHAGWIFGTGAFAVLVGALAFAWWMSRRITAPIDALASSARTLDADPGKASTLGPSGIAEIDTVAQALAEAGTAVRERRVLMEREQTALREADRAKDEFLAMLGHELRNPLSAVMTSLQVMRSPGVSEATRLEAQSIVERQARQMKRLVDDLLDVSRLAMGKLVLHRDRFDLSNLAADFVLTWERSGRLAPGRVRVRAYPVWVEADRSRIEQVFANLLDNANKFTPAEGKIHLRVSPEGTSAVIEVLDEGAGISPAMLDRIFDRFVQGAQGLDRAEGGLGLGLAIVKRLVELHGGKVQAANREGRPGARFVVRLPAVTPGVLRESVDNPIGTTRRLRILVVEDIDDARDMLEALLTLNGHEVRVAATAAAALEDTGSWLPDVALLDIGLPDMSGYELAKALRQRSTTATTFLVAITGYGQIEDELKAYEAGFDLHLTKPVDPEALMQVLARIATGPREFLPLDSPGPISV